jgi:mannose-6-phosphate isomerase-like protein (cupin superfamily)
MSKREKFTVFDYGAPESWDEHVYRVPPNVAEITGNNTVPGRRYGLDDLSLEFMDFSINKLAPGMEVPLHYRHTNQEEVYFGLEGQGELCLDGELVSLTPGVAVRVSPEIMRSIRNCKLDEPLYFLAFRAQGDRIQSLRDDVEGMSEFDWDEILL